MFNFKWDEEELICFALQLHNHWYVSNEQPIAKHCEEPLKLKGTVSAGLLTIYYCWCCICIIIEVEWNQLVKTFSSSHPHKQKFGLKINFL